MSSPSDPTNSHTGRARAACLAGRTPIFGAGGLPSAYPGSSQPRPPALPPMPVPRSNFQQGGNSSASDAVEEVFLDDEIHRRSDSDDQDGLYYAPEVVQAEVNPYSPNYAQQSMKHNEAEVRATMSKRDLIWSYLRLQPCGALRKMGLLGAVNVKQNERKSIA
jgi:hypothetical protein